MDWTRGHKIGSGSSATVFIATSPSSGEIFAVKSTGLTQSATLQKERQILSSMSSSRIVTYKGCDITSENNKLIFNLLMEYVPGGSLSDEISRRGCRLEEQLIRLYTKQLLEGLAYLHDKGLIHSDVKASNILISDDGVKISDFGCARRMNPVEDTALSVGGTPMFMSPEAARMEDQGFPGDIWAVGCTVIEMATGGSPWKNETDPVSLLYRIGYTEDSPEIPNFLGNQAKDFLGKCFLRNPKDRWTASQLLNHPFFEEYDSISHKVEEFGTDSPTSILDQCIWRSAEEPQTDLSNLVPTTIRSSPDDRIRRLSLISEKSSWREEEDWITVRGVEKWVRSTFLNSNGRNGFLQDCLKTNRLRESCVISNADSVRHRNRANSPFALIPHFL